MRYAWLCYLYGCNLRLSECIKQRISSFLVGCIDL